MSLSKLHGQIIGCCSHQEQLVELEAKVSQIRTELDQLIEWISSKFGDETFPRSFQIKIRKRTQNQHSISHPHAKLSFDNESETEHEIQHSQNHGDPPPIEPILQQFNIDRTYKTRSRKIKATAQNDLDLESTKPKLIKLSQTVDKVSENVTQLKNSMAASPSIPASIPITAESSDIPAEPELETSVPSSTKLKSKTRAKPKPKKSVNSSSSSIPNTIVYNCKYPNCLKNFVQKQKIINHISQNHISKSSKPLIICKLCGFVCSDEQSFFKHRSGNHANEELYHCNLCPMNFVRRKLFNQHLAKLHPERRKEYPCRYCNQASFTSTEELNSHIESLHQNSTTPWECHICGRTFSESFNRNRHVKTHTIINISPSEQQSYPCPICNKTFPSAFKLKLHHKRVHSEASGIRKFLCEICGLQFKANNTKNEHVRRIHGDKARPQGKCDKCGKTFKYASSVKRHQENNRCFDKNAQIQVDPQKLKLIILKHRRLRQKTQEQLFIKAKEECLTCKELKDLNNPKKLKRHINAEHKRTGPSNRYFVPPPCEICGKVFKQKSAILEHYSTVHSLQNMTKLYKCNVSGCGKRFKFNSKLRDHTVVHTGAKPYVCEICGHRFNQEQTKIKHYAVHLHALEKLYNCEFCEKSFRFEIHRKTHIRKVHPNKIKGKTNSKIGDDNTMPELDKQVEASKSVIPGVVEDFIVLEMKLESDT